MKLRINLKPYQDLVLMGVGTNNVENVVRTVLKSFTKLEVESLPKTTFSRLMFLEARRISQIHVAESLTKNFESYQKLYMDGKIEPSCQNNIKKLMISFVVCITLLA